MSLPHMLRRFTAVLLLTACHCHCAFAQAPARFVPTALELQEAYRRSAEMAALPNGKVFKLAVSPNWFSDQSRFWYRNDLPGGQKEFILVDAEHGVRSPAFDHTKLAAGLSKAAKQTIDAKKLPFDTLEFVDDKTIRFTFGDVHWQCDLTTHVCTKTTTAPNRPTGNLGKLVGGAGGGPMSWPDFGQTPNGEVPSPDKKWVAFIKNYNVFLRPATVGPDTKISETGVAGRPFGAIIWSPDSKKLLASRIEPGEHKQVHLIASSTKDTTRGVLQSREYAQPGDRFNTYEMWVFDVEEKKGIKVDLETIDFGADYGQRPVNVLWREDNKRFLFERTDRGHQRYRVIEVDAVTGKTRNIIDEKPSTFINSVGKFIQFVDRGKEIIWTSEKDGWKHLYLSNGQTGETKPITSGSWVVRGIERVDTVGRQIWFRAGGIYPDQDPYHVHFCRINFDGTGLVKLTASNGTHSVKFSAARDAKYMVDVWSRVDAPPVSVLRRTSDGSLICELERADVSTLLSAGWKYPEIFTAKGRDNTTDIWGIVVRPRNFNPARKYPVIEYIYAGPQDSFVPKAFQPYLYNMHSLAELGFIVVQIDGMGTANRSKAFHDVCWKNIADAGFPDRIAWLKALAAKDASLDLERVGIFGTSAGGQSSTGALLFHGDFYKVAVSACGCHDNRIDKAWWNEQWMGYPIGPHYDQQSNITNAAKLKGKLMLIVGELDRNVPPESTFRLADALIKARRDFELVVVPGSDHGDGGPFGHRKRMDFFVQHLFGVTPPNWPTN